MRYLGERISVKTGRRGISEWYIQDVRYMQRKEVEEEAVTEDLEKENTGNSISSENFKGKNSQGIGGGSGSE